MSNLSDLYIFQYGKGNTNPDNGGRFPIYGSNGIIGGYHEYNSEDAPVIGHIGANCGEVIWGHGKHYVTYNGIICKVKQNINKHFAYYTLLNSKLKDRIRGSAQPFISYDLLNEVVVRLPDIEEQKRIGNLLWSIDSKIRNNNAIISELEALTRTIYDYWFQQFEFPNEEGRSYKSSGGIMIWNEELKKEIPLGWECVTLAELFSFTKGKIPAKLYDENDGTLSPYLTIDVVNNGTPQYCNQTSMPFCDKKTIMVMDGAASGDVYTGYTGVLGSTFAMLNPKRKDVSNELLYWILKTLGVIYKKNNTGSTVPHANKSYIGELKIALPKSCEKLSKIFVLNQDKINFLNEENRELINLRKFLLPLLINGQVTFMVQ